VALVIRGSVAANLAFKRLTADVAEPCGKEPISRRIRLTVPTAASLVKASLASSLWRQVGPEISGCTELSVAFAFFVKSATGAHPHVGGSTAENCAARDAADG
jgi:hypothetical protein